MHKKIQMEGTKKKKTSHEKSQSLYISNTIHGPTTATISN